MHTKAQTFHISTAVFGALRGLSVLALALVFILGFPAGHAKSATGIDVQRFKPAIHTHGFIRVESAKISPGLDGDDWDARIPVMPNSFLVFNYAEAPSLNGTSSQTTLDNLSTLNFISSLAFYNHFSVGFDLPIHLARAGQRLEGISNQLYGYPGAGIGDLRLSLKMAVYEARKKKPGVAVQVDFGVPTGAADGFTDEKAFFVEPKVLLEASGPMIRIAYNASYLYRSKRLVDAVPSELDTLWDAADSLDAVSLNARFRHEMRHMVGVGVAPKALPDAIEFVLEAAFATSLGRPLEQEVTSLESGFGLKYLHDSGVSIGAGSSFGIFDGYGDPDWRTMVIFGYQQERYLPDDNDQDGLDNDVDKCPEDPEDMDGFEDSDGCPDLDNDDDQILDVVDQCPLEPEDMDGVADDDGCPDMDTDKDGLDDLFDKCPEEPEDFDNYKDDDGCPDIDTDKDGIHDDIDQCPKIPEDLDKWKDEDGCPEKDNDEDGIIDSLDQCPNEREDLDKIQDNDGCPESDADEDGVLDINDRCPLEPENVNGCEDDDGCAEAKKVCVGAKKIVISDKIFFATGRDRILRKSNDLLDELAGVMLNHPEIELIEIQGHTDSKGNNKRNLRLSEKRAKSVYKYLVKLGVPKTKLTFKGYGEERPLMENDTDEGRAANRRVEFVILKQASDTTRGKDPIAPIAKPKCEDLSAQAAKKCCTGCGGRWAPEPGVPLDPMSSCLMDGVGRSDCVVNCIASAPVPTDCE